MKFIYLLTFLAITTSCGHFEKTEGRSIASVDEYIDINVDGKKEKLFYRGVSVYDQPKGTTAFIIFNPHIKISQRNVLITDPESALELCRIFTNKLPELNAFDRKIASTNGDIKEFGYFKDNTIGLVPDTKTGHFHIQTKMVHKNFFEEIHCALKK